MTGAWDGYAYCGVVNIDTVRMSFFLENIKYLEVCYVYVGDAYLHGFINYNIYMVTGP